MGADAEVFLFDYQRYRDEVVPALLELLGTGRAPTWLAEFIERCDEHEVYGRDWTGILIPYLRAHPTDVARYCTHLTADLSYRGSEWIRRGWGEQTYSPCRSAECPERGGCPMHEAQAQGPSGGSEILELLTALFEGVVAVHCLTSSQFVGRSQYALNYLPLLTTLGIGAGDPVRDLFVALELRGRVLGYQFAGSEGIHGWLTPAETAELRGRLRNLELPEYEATLDGMRAHRQVGADGVSSYPAHEFDRLSLSFIRTMATIAAEADMGLLWGNDVSPDLWWEHCHPARS
jgi:hypothetical protein